MAAKRTTICPCGQPRDLKSKKPLCVECRRKASAIEMRIRRGMPLDVPFRKPTPSVPGCIVEGCPNDKHRNNRCREHYNEQIRLREQAKGRRTIAEYHAERWAKKMTDEERIEDQARSQAKRKQLYERRAAEGLRLCKTPGCDGKVTTPYGTKCDPCKYVAQSVGAELNERTAGVPRSVALVDPKPVVVKVSKPRHKQAPPVVVRRRPVVQPEIVIGPEAFQRVQPVDVKAWGKPIVRQTLPDGWGR